MPVRASHLPNHLERSCLLELRALGESRAAQLHAGKRTIIKMIEKGWIERAELAYRITPTGEAALKAKIPTPKRNRNTGAHLAGLKARGK